MRRLGRSVHRKRIETVTGQPDAVALALPGLACGLLAALLVLYAATIRRTPPVLPLTPISRAGSSTIAPLGTAQVAPADTSSLASLTSAQRSERP